jgi:hypothetical protein
MGRWMDRWADGQVEEHIGWWTNELADKQTDGQMNRQTGCCKGR